MKRFIITFSIFAVLAVVPLVSLAATNGSIIQNILKLLNRGNLPAAVNTAVSNLNTSNTGTANTGDVDPQGNVSTCVALKNNLRYRTRDAQVNGEVSTLQDFLQTNGFLNSEPTGYMGLLTVKAVSAFQTSAGLTASGYVGPLTRATIKAQSCGGTPVPTPVPTPTEPWFNLTSNSVPTDIKGATVIQYSATFDGVHREPAYISFNLSCPQGVSANIQGEDIPRCNKTTYMKAVKDGLYQITIVFINSTSQTQTIGASASINGLNGVGNADKDAISIIPSSSQTAQPSIIVTYPLAGAQFTAGDVIKVSSTYSNLSSGPKDVKVYLGGSGLVGRNVPTLVSFGSSLPKEFSVTLPADLPTGIDYIISVCDEGTPSPLASFKPLCGNSGRFTVSAPVSIPKTSSVSLTSSSIALGYDSAQKESSLTATFALKVTAGSKDLKIPKGAANLDFIDQNGKAFYANSSRNTITATSPAADGVDVYNLPVIIIPAGSTVSLSVVGSINPRELPAGSYHASLKSIYNDTNNTSNLYEYLIVPTNSTESKTIVGEVAPYISSGTYADGKVLLTGIRFPAKVTAVIGGYNFSNLVTDNNGTSLTFAPEGVPAGSYCIYIVNTTLGSEAGKSNSYCLNLGGTPVTPPVVSIVGNPQLALSYDSNKRESSLVGSFTVAVKATSADVHLIKNGFSITTTGGTNADNVNGMTQAMTPVPGSVVTSYVDNYGNTIYTIPAGKTVSFLLTRTTNPQLMYSGYYSESLSQLYAVDQNANSFAVSVPFNHTNGVTVVGESAVVVTPLPTPAPTPVPVPVVAPTLTLTASDPVFQSNAWITNLSWASENATKCVKTGAWTEGAIPSPTSATGEGRILSAGSNTYTMTCTGAGGSVSKSVTVSAVPTLTLTAAIPVFQSNAYITHLVWSSARATKCVKTGAWTEGVIPSPTSGAGDLILPSAGVGTYTMTCSSSLGTVTKSVTVTREATTVPPTQGATN